MNIKTIIGIGALCAIGFSACAEIDNEPKVAVPAAVVAAEAVETTAAPETSEQVPVEKAGAEASGPKETRNQANARAKAESYLDGMAFSQSGLIDQLEYEGYSKADATYGVKAVGADWKEQAALKAASYLDGQAFSWQGLFDQLEYEGFTAMQAEYGVNQTGLTP